MQHDDAFLDSVAVLALGALPEGEAADVRAHLATCAACRQEFHDLRSAANFVGVSAELAPGALDEVSSARMKSRVMREVRASVPATAALTATAASTAATTAKTNPPGWLLYGALAAAVALAVFQTANVAGLNATHASDTQRIAELQAQTAGRSADAARAQATAAVVAQMVASGSKHYAVPNGEVITANGHVFIALSHLPAAPDGKVYQAWTLKRGAKTVAPSITFPAQQSGPTIIELPEAATGLVAVALSVEPAGGSKAPTSKPAFVRPLS